MNFFWVKGLLVALLLGLTGNGLWAQGVTEMTLCESVVNNEPFNPGQSFAQGQKAYCWLKVEGAEPGDYVLVQWWWDGSLQHEEKLRLGDTKWRTHCYKTLYQAGAWQVKVVNSAGQVLNQQEFASYQGDLAQVGENADPLPSPEVRTERSQPISLSQSRGTTLPNLAPSRWMSQGNPQQVSSSRVVIIMPDVHSNALELWASLDIGVLDSMPEWREAWVMLPAGNVLEQGGSYENLSLDVDRYEKRILADLDAQSRLSAQPLEVLVLAQGEGADVAWAIIQRYPDRFSSALLVGCECGYYQRSSMEEQTARGMRYVFVSGSESSYSEGFDQLGMTLNRLARSEVFHQTYERAGTPTLSSLRSQFIRQAVWFLTDHNWEK